MNAADRHTRVLNQHPEEPPRSPEQLGVLLDEIRTAIELARATVRIEHIRHARILSDELTRGARSVGRRGIVDAALDLQRELEDAPPPWTSVAPLIDHLKILVDAEVCGEHGTVGAIDSALAAHMTNAGPQNEAIPRVMIVDPSNIAQQRASSHCGSRLAHLSRASTVAEALQSGQMLDVILLDVEASAPEGLPRAVAALRDMCPSQRVAVAITSPVDDLPTRVAAARAGAEMFLVKPLGRQALRDAIHQLWQRARAPRGRVLVLDDDPDFVEMATMMLDNAGYATVGLTDSEPLLESLRRLRPDAVLVDFGMPRYGGIELTAMLRGSREFANTPVLFVSGNRDPSAIRAAFAAGADDYLVKPLSSSDLTLRLDARIERSRQLRVAAERDPLSGLLVRGPFIAALENRLASALRDGTRLTFCLIDLDQFKRVNDIHGHLVGDEVLAAFGELLSQFRAEDLKCRWGGEEFAIAFPNDQPISVVHALIERLLEQFRAMTFTDRRGETFSVSFSAGVAQFTPDHGDMDELLQNADRRLYQAKRQGRAAVVSADSD
ncbi:MAG TPA: diguanylate cyclase [Kofleriaceae bacterium]|nr:diguanylate cyclase [Kofleriaceae bacterium]